MFKTKRKFLNGNVFLYKNNYYKITDEHDETQHFYIGTSVEARENIFDNIITVHYNKKINSTVLVEKEIKKALGIDIFQALILTYIISFA